MTNSNDAELYRCAFDKNNNLIHIDKVTEEIKRINKVFICPSCNGEMMPVINVTKRVKHFRHYNIENDRNCDSETYIHRTCKELLKKRFDESETFIVKYYIDVICTKENCALLGGRSFSPCQEKRLIEEDLKKTYTDCKIEERDGQFIPDLKLINRNNPDIDPLYLEIFYTHSCTEEKRSSGKQIIEIKVNRFEDINVELEESSEENYTNVTFYNFNKPIKGSLSKGILGIAKSDSPYYYALRRNNYNCKEELPQLNQEEHIAEILYTNDTKPAESQEVLTYLQSLLSLYTSDDGSKYHIRYKRISNPPIVERVSDGYPILEKHPIIKREKSINNRIVKPLETRVQVTNSTENTTSNNTEKSTVNYNVFKLIKRPTPKLPTFEEAKVAEFDDIDPYTETSLSNRTILSIMLKKIILKRRIKIRYKEYYTCPNPESNCIKTLENGYCNEGHWKDYDLYNDIIRHIVGGLFHDNTVDYKAVLKYKKKNDPFHNDNAEIVFVIVDEDKVGKTNYEISEYERLIELSENYRIENNTIEEGPLARFYNFNRFSKFTEACEADFLT